MEIKRNGRCIVGARHVIAQHRVMTAVTTEARRHAAVLINALSLFIVVIF